MKKPKLPLPVLILILATLFLLSSAFGEWIGRPSTPLRAPARETVEQQQAAIVYIRVMSWLSRVIARPAAHSEGNSESAQPADPAKGRMRAVPAYKPQSCTLNKPSRSSMKLCKYPKHEPTIPNRGHLTADKRLARTYHCTRTRYFRRDSALAATGTWNCAANAAVFSYL